MKILHVSPTYYSTSSVVGGGEKYIVYMIRALAISAFESGMPIQNGVLAFGEQPGLHALDENIVCEVLRGKPWDPFSVDVAALVLRIKQYDIVVVHQCLTAFGLFVGSHAKLAGRKVVGVDEGGGEHPSVGHSREGANMFDVFVAYSAYVECSFAGLDVPVHRILGPVDTNYYTPESSIKRVENLVLAVGRILPHKGFDRVVKAIKPPLKLVIAGTRSDDAYWYHLKGLTGRCDAEVKIVEGLDDGQLLTLIRSASLFIHASTHVDYAGKQYAKPELLGLAPLEALACGTPAFVSTAGSLGELAAITGCQSFTSDLDLIQLLQSFTPSTVPSAQAIHRSVKLLYGLEQFGERFLTLSAKLLSLRSRSPERVVNE